MVWSVHYFSQYSYRTHHPTSLPAPSPQATQSPATRNPSATQAPTEIHSYFVESTYFAQSPCAGPADLLYIRPLDTCVSFPNGSLMMAIDPSTNFPAMDFTETWFQRMSDCTGHSVLLNYSYSARCGSNSNHSLVATISQGPSTYTFPPAHYFVSRYKVVVGRLSG